MTENKSTDEIDLMELFVNGYGALKKNLLLFILFPLAGVGIALLIAFNSKDKFASTMMVSTKLLTHTEAKFIVEQLAQADSIPGLSEDIRSKIVSLRFNVENQVDPEGEVYFRLNAEVRNPSVFQDIQTVCTAYINDSEPVKRNREDQILKNKELIQKINQEIAAMELVKEQSDSRAMATYINPSALYSKTIELYEQRIGYEIALQRIKSLNIVKGFDSLIKDARISKVIAAAIGGICGLLIVVTILFLQYFNAYMQKLHAK